MHSTKMRNVAALAASGLLAAGCGGGGAPGQPTGSLSLSVTDMPVDYAAEVVVAMTEFEFKPQDGPSFRVPVLAEDGMPLGPGESRAINLLDYTNGATAEIIREEIVPAGYYNWLRIFFDPDASYIVLEEGGEQYPLQIPSGAQTGYKLVSGFTVPINASVEYILDFIVRKSVHRAPGQAIGEMPVYTLKPTVKIMNAEDTGGVMGTVAVELIDMNNERCSMADPPLEGNAVYAFEGADATVDDDADPDMEADDASPAASDIVELNNETGEYEYHLMFMLPGTYTLAFTCSAAADGSGDDDYDAATGTPGPSGFDFDATIHVTVEADMVSDCPIAMAGANPDCPTP